MYKKKSEVQFKFLFSLIFATFFFIFLFYFLANAIITYQEYALISLYTSLSTLIDIISLKKNTAAIIEITKARDFEIEIKNDSVKVEVFLKKRSFPIYDQLVIANKIRTNKIYYENKPVFFPFYVGSIIYLLPLEKKDRENIYLLTYRSPYTYFDLNEIMKVLFPVEGFSKELPFFKDSISGFLDKRISAKNLRVLILTNDSLTVALSEFANNIQKLRNSNYQYIWAVSIKPVKDLEYFIYKVEFFEKKLKKEDFISLLQSPTIKKGFIKEYYIPREMLLATLMVDSERELKYLIEKLMKKIYFSYLAYSFHKSDNEFISICNPYQEIEEVISKLEEYFKGNYCNTSNITYCLKNEVQSIFKRNSEKELSDKPICTLY